MLLYFYLNKQNARNNMKKYDIFVSHSSKDDNIVMPIVSALEAKGIKCWIAPRDVIGPYAKAITEAIKSSKIFLLCLSHNSAVSEHVLNEIEIAYNPQRQNVSNILIEPFLIEPIDFYAKEFDEIMYYIRRINVITPLNNNTPTELADLIIHKNREILQLSSPKKKSRKESLYFSSQREDLRLKYQNELTKRFDGEAYKEIFSIYPHMNILDVGCGNGDLIMDRLKCYANTYKLCAFDRDKDKITYAKKHYADKNTSFYEINVTDDNFEAKLKEITNNLCIDKFDVIHISMLLLHLKNPVQLLRILRRFLKTNGILFIKDIDDGLNFAYPDEDGAFERIYKICDSNETSGNRHSGRQIFSNLLKSGFHNISLRKEGFDSIGMDYDEKEKFFSMYCQFIYGDIKWMHEKYPQNQTITEDYQWYRNNYENIFDRFMAEDFIFCLGFQIYLAKK